MKLNGKHKFANAYRACHKYYMQMKSMEAFSSTSILFDAGTGSPCKLGQANKDTDRQTNTHIDRQRPEHMSWRTLNTATVSTAAAHTYGLGQRECDLQTLPLSRRRKMGQNNRNRLRRFLHQLFPQHYMLQAVPKRLVVTAEGDLLKPQKVTRGCLMCMVRLVSSCPVRLL